LLIFVAARNGKGPFKNVARALGRKIKLAGIKRTIRVKNVRQWERRLLGKKDISFSGFDSVVF
jgi:hypothetical protein